MAKTRTKTVDTVKTQEVPTTTPAQQALVTMRSMVRENVQLSAARELGKRLEAARVAAIDNATAMLDDGPDAVTSALKLVHLACASGADRRQLEAIVLVEHAITMVDAWKLAREAGTEQDSAHAVLDVQAELLMLARRMPRSIRNNDEVTTLLRGLARTLDATSRVAITAQPRHADYSEQYKTLSEREDAARVRRLKAAGKLSRTVSPATETVKADA